MLKNKRKLRYLNLKSLIITSILLGALMMSKANAQAGVPIDKVIAVIADQIVLQSELEAAAIAYARQGNPVESNTRCVIFEDLLFKKLMINQAKVDSLEVSDDQINSEISNRIQYFVQQIGSEKKLEEFYEKSIPEIREEFYDLIKEQMLTQQMQGSITAGVDISPKEVKEFFTKIPKDSLPFINSEVVVEHIVVDPVINEDEKNRTREKLEGFRERILKGEDFGTLAFLYSQDPGSARKNGELGFMERGALVKEFAGVAFSIQPGQVSEIFETEYGFHIVQLIERRGQQANVRHILLKPQVSAADLAESKMELDSIRTQILEVDSISFEIMASKYSDDKSTRMNGGKLINRESGSTTFEIDQISKVDPSLFFILDKMEPGDISTPVIHQKLDGSQSYRLVKLVSVTEAHRANLETDYLKIQSAAKAEKEKIAVDKWITSKIKVNYVKIDDSFQDCEFQHKWL